MPFSFTEEQDQHILAAYSPPYIKGSVNRLAREFNTVPSVINYRARQLGKKPISYHSTIKKKNWSDEELFLLNEHSWLNDYEMSDLFEKNGYKRSTQSIKGKREQLGWSAKLERDETVCGYTAISVSKLLKVHESTVLRWISNKYLKAQHGTGIDIREKQHWRIQRKHLKEFMLNHPTRWSAKNVDHIWMCDLFKNP